MPWRRHDSPPPAQELGAAERARAELEHLGAIRFAIPRGFWVYALLDHAGACFYVGKSDHLARRLADHADSWGEHLADIWVIKCRDEHQMEVRELYLIDALQPPVNKIGTAAYERQRRAKTMGAPAPWVPGAPRAAKQAVPLDETTAGSTP
jgi:hypothetical protein